MRYNPVNKELYEKTKAFSMSAMKLLLSYLRKGEEVPSIMVEKHKIEAEGGLNTEYVREPAYFMLVECHKEDVENLPEYHECIESIRSDSIISKHLDCLVGTSVARLYRTAWHYLSYFLTRQLQQLSGRSEFDIETFDRNYHDLEEFFYSDTLEFRILVPVHNFNSDVDEIELEDGMWIRRLTRTELEKILNRARFFLQSPFLDETYLKFAIELDYKRDKVFEEPQMSVLLEDVDIEDRIHTLITALRLFKPGMIGFKVTITEPILDLPIPMKRYSSSHTHYPMRLLGLREYTLAETEIDKFKSFWNKFNNINLREPSSLGVAIRRFNYAYERSRLEDKLIDYMVAFEALFLRGEMGELGHKLSVRVSRLLGQTYEQRQEIFKLMKDFYRKRSKIVQGETVSLSNEFINTVEDHLRTSIKLLLDCLQRQSHDEIISRLDLG